METSFNIYMLLLKNLSLEINSEPQEAIFKALVAK